MKHEPLTVVSVDWEPDPTEEQRCYFTVHCLNSDGGRVFVMPCDVGDDVVVQVGSEVAATKEQIAASWLRYQWDHLPDVGLDAGLRDLSVPEIPPHVSHSG